MVPNGSAGICFSMVRPTRLDVFQWSVQRAWTFFNGSPNVFQWFDGSAGKGSPPNAPGRFSMVRPTGPGRFVFQGFAQRARGVSFFNGSPNAPGGVSFFNGSPNVSDFDMWRHANPLNSHTARAPCYMCYMCYMGLTRQPDEPPLSPSSLLYVLYAYMGLTRQPAEPPHSRAPCYMCYMCYMGLTRQPAELYTIHIASQHVPHMPYIAHIVQISRVQNI